MDEKRKNRQTARPSLDEMSTAELKERFLELEARNETLRQSEQEKRLILDNAVEIISFHDVEHNLVWANKAYVKATGNPLSDMKWCKCYHAWGLEQECVGCPVSKALETGKPHQSEMNPLSQPDWTAEHRSWLVSSTPVKDDNGNITGAIEIAHDITEQKKTEYELANAYRLLESVSNSTHVMLACLDRDFNFLWVNRTYAQAAGKQPEDYIGKNHFDLYPHAENEAIFQSVVDTGETFQTYAKPFKHPEQPERGTTYWDWRLEPLFDEKGKVEGLIFSLTDVTESERTKRKLRNNEKQLRLITDSVPILISYVDTEERYQFNNKRYEEWFGYSREKMKGRQVKDVLGDDAYQKVKSYIKSALAGEQSVHECEIPHNDGGTRYVRVSYTPDTDDNGVVKGYYALVDDITERKEMEKQLRRERELFRGVFDNIPVMLVLWEANLQRFSLNVYATKVLGWTDEDANNGDFMAKVYPDPDYRAEISAFMESLSPEWREIEVTAKDGSIIPSNWTNTFLTDNTMIGIGVDMRERKRKEQELQRARNELEQRVEERTNQLRALAAELANAEERERERLAGILHDEVQQQLAALRLKINLLATDTQQDQKIKSQMDESIGMVDDAIAQTRNLSHDLSPASLHLHGLFNALESMVENMQHDHGLDVFLELDPEAEPQRVSTASMLFRAIKELLFNVVKHSGQKEAYIEAKRNDDEIHFSVVDYGVGMTQEVLQDKRNSAGGLGLFGLEQRIVYLGGHMEVKGIPGKGTRITLILPTSKAEALQSESGEERKVAAEKPQAEQPNETQQPGEVIRILVADDHTVMRESLAVRLENENDFTIVSQVSTGRDAIRLAEELKPDVMIMDVRMPDITGIEATSEIKRRFPQVHIIGLSMHSDSETALKMKQAGAEAFLSKSDSPKHLYDAIRKVAEMKKTCKASRSVHRD